MKTLTKKEEYEAKKALKEKKRLDLANKTKGELGREKKTIKYVINAYANLWETKELLIRALKGLYNIFLPNRNVLIGLRKNNKITELDFCSLLARDVLLILIAPKEPAHFDFFDKYKHLQEAKEVLDIFNANTNYIYKDSETGEVLKKEGVIVGYGIKIDLDSEIELMELFEGGNLIEKADTAIKVSKWIIDFILKEAEDRGVLSEVLKENNVHLGGGLIE